MTMQQQGQNPGVGDPEPITVRIATAIQMLGLSRSKFYELIDEDIIVRKKSGRASLILVSSLHDYVASLPTE
jgi:ACT domain-containing protein